MAEVILANIGQYGTSNKHVVLAQRKHDWEVAVAIVAINKSSLTEDSGAPPMTSTMRTSWVARTSSQARWLQGKVTAIIMGETGEDLAKEMVNTG